MLRILQMSENVRGLACEQTLTVGDTSKAIDKRSESRRGKEASANESLHGRYRFLNTYSPFEGVKSLKTR